MLSPFPGMDPYLEDPAFWPDFHQRFITYLCDQVADRLPESYEARIDERIHLVEWSEDGAQTVKPIRPDVAVTQHYAPSMARESGSSSVSTLEPITIPLMLGEEVRETSIHILHRPQRKLVTVLELLSPSNKRDDPFNDYFNRRFDILQQRVHLAELDLLVGGLRIALSRPLPPADYYAFVARSDRRPQCDVYGWSVRQPLPTIPIPLRSPDPDVRLNVAEVFAIAYERGRYARSINYGLPPVAPLGPDDLTWASGVGKAFESGRLKSTNR